MTDENDVKDDPLMDETAEIAEERAAPTEADLAAGEDLVDTVEMDASTVAERVADALAGAAADAESDNSDDDIERLYTRADVDKIEAAAKDRHLRLFAEFENFRRRTAREKEKWSDAAIEDFVRDLLPVFDSFDKARATPSGDAGAMLEGLELTYKQLHAALAKNDIEVIDPLGEAFDPRWHEALMRRPSEDAEAGTVLEVFERGYRIGKLLIRPARTVVASEE